MGKIPLLSPVKIITGLISNDVKILDKISYMLFKELGPIDLESHTLPFNTTRYYNDEMGDRLKRKFLSFQKLKDLENIYKLKIFTNKLEDRFSVSGKRRINIDPGYLTLGKLVLLTTKNYTHRLYLKNGVHAEVTLFFKDKSYQPWEWTYPDYKTKEYIDFFNRVRQIYIEGLKRKE